MDEIVGMNKDLINAAIKKLKQKNKQAYLDNYNAIAQYMSQRAKEAFENNNNKRMMKMNLMKYIKHPSIQMKVLEKDLKRKIVNAIAKEHVRMRSNHSKPVHKKTRRL